MKRSCLAMLALLVLAARAPMGDGLTYHGDLHDSHGAGLALRQLPGAAATADYVPQRYQPASGLPAVEAAAVAARGDGGRRYVF